MILLFSVPTSTILIVLAAIIAWQAFQAGIVYLLVYLADQRDALNGQPGPGLYPIDFAERNVEIAKDQPQYRTLPAFVDPDDPYGHRITCWQVSYRDRLKLLLTGRLWVDVMSFNQPLQPLFFSVNKADVLEEVSADV